MSSATGVSLSHKSILFFQKSTVVTGFPLSGGSYRRWTCKIFDGLQVYEQKIRQNYCSGEKEWGRQKLDS